MSDDTTRGVHLNEKQLVFVLMAGGVICGVIFLFGVLVGRGVHAERGSVAEGSMMSAPQSVPDPAPPAAATGASPTGSQIDDLSYQKRLSQPDTPVEPLKPPPAVPPAGDVAGSATTAGPPQLPPDVSEELPAADVGARATTGSFTVQVVALPKRVDAELVAGALKAKGYDARVVAPDAGDTKPRFRVRIGTYKTRREADIVARKLASEGKYNPWVTR